MLTIFTAPKPFGGDIRLIQENAIDSWKRLHTDIEVLLLGDEQGLEGAAEELGVRHLGGVRVSEWGTPLVDSLFDRARRAASFHHLCFVNTDIILMPDLLDALMTVKKHFEQFLVVGQRWDLLVQERITFDNGWQSKLREETNRRGRLHPPAGSDYFIFDRSQFEGVPPFAIGRAGWDNWMIYEARRTGTPVVDATNQITAIHQDHDYSHLPGSQPHYRLPESQRNLQLAGGRHTVFTLRDATWELAGGELRHRKASWGRAIEADVFARLGPTLAARAAYAAFHPVETINWLRGAVQGLLRMVSATEGK